MILHFALFAILSKKLGFKPISAKSFVNWFHCREAKLPSV